VFGKGKDVELGTERGEGEGGELRTWIFEEFSQN